MLNHRRAVFLALAVAPCPLAAQAAWTPVTRFAPFVDMSSWPTPDLASLYNASGTNDYTLAFITADPNDNPAWGGYATYDAGSGQLDAGINSGISTLRSHGGDVAISFGGQSGTDLADTTTSLSTLQTDYQNVLSAYNVHRVDFDIEGTNPANHAAVDLRFAAISNLQKAAPANAPLSVTLTLPVEPTGLDANALYAVQSAISHGVTLSSVNIMAMQFGDDNAPNGTTQMGNYVIESAQSTFNQLKTLYNGTKTDGQIYAMLGITPMIGQNSPDEIFSTNDANQVGMWAAQHQVGLLSFWLATRDHPGDGDYNSETDSGISQTDYQFAKIFQTWADAIPGDANNDGVVNAVDLGILATHYNSTSANWNTGDYNGDGIVNAVDLGILATHYNATLGPDSFDEALAAYPTLDAAYLGSSSVPEPGALALLALGMPLLFRRRKTTENKR